MGRVVLVWNCPSNISLFFLLYLEKKRLKNIHFDLKKQLKDVTSMVIKVADDKNLSDDLTLVGSGN